MNTTATRALIEQFNDARAICDTVKVASLLSQDVVCFLPIGYRQSGGGTIEGRDEVANQLTGVPGSTSGSILKMDTVSRDVQKLVVEGDTAVGFHYVSAELVQGGPYFNEYVWQYTCDDGKIIRIREFADTLHASNQIRDLAAALGE